MRKRVERTLPSGVVERRCFQCHTWLPRTADHFHRRGEQLHSECKACANAAAREYQRERYVPGSRRKPSEAPRRLLDASALAAAMAGRLLSA